MEKSTTQSITKLWSTADIFCLTTQNCVLHGLKHVKLIRTRKNTFLFLFTQVSLKINKKNAIFYIFTFLNILKKKLELKDFI